MSVVSVKKLCEIVYNTLTIQTMDTGMVSLGATLYEDMTTLGNDLNVVVNELANFKTACVVNPPNILKTLHSVTV